MVKSGFATVNVSGGAVQSLWSGEESLEYRAFSERSLSRDGSVSAVIRQSASTPPEVWAGPIGKWKQLTTVNADVKPAWGEMRNFHWTNGTTKLQGWLMLPKDFDPDKKYPLIVNVHGGPSAACGSRWDSRTLGPESAMGYFAFCPNPRGSYGQGRGLHAGQRQRFRRRRLSRHHGRQSTRSSKQYPIDTHRLGIRGHSYGGYMTMWAETQTHRFAAAVAGAGLLRLAQLLRRERHRRVDDSVLRRVGLRRSGRVREERSHALRQERARRRR